jgi:hypothetical protein
VSNKHLTGKIFVTPACQELSIRHTPKIFASFWYDPLKKKHTIKDPCFIRKDKSSGEFGRAPAEAVFGEPSVQIFREVISKTVPFLQGLNYSPMILLQANVVGSEVKTGATVGIRRHCDSIHDNMCAIVTLQIGLKNVVTDFRVAGPKGKEKYRISGKASVYAIVSPGGSAGRVPHERLGTPGTGSGFVIVLRIPSSTMLDRERNHRQLVNNMRLGMNFVSERYHELLFGPNRQGEAPRDFQSLTKDLEFGKLLSWCPEEPLEAPRVNSLMKLYDKSDSG